MEDQINRDMWFTLIFKGIKEEREISWADMKCKGKSRLNGSSLPPRHFINPCISFIGSCRNDRTFDHHNYARYLSYQHALVNDLKVNNTSSFQDLAFRGMGANYSGTKFASVHGDLTE